MHLQVPEFVAPALEQITLLGEQADLAILSVDQKLFRIPYYYARYWYVHVAVSLSIGPPLPGRACLAALRWLPMKILVNIGQESYFQILGANGVFAGL